MYEALLDLIEHNDDIKAILQKGSRITETTSLEPGIMGFIYKNGDIHIGCGDVDYLELDSLLLDSNGNFCVVEMLNGVNNLDSLVREYWHREIILKKLTGKEIIPYILVSSEDIRHKKPVMDVTSNPHAYFVQIGFESYDPEWVKDAPS